MLSDDRREAVAAKETWAMDFVHDQLQAEREIRILAVVDTFSRRVPVLDPRFGYRGGDVVRSCAVIGYPQRAIRKRASAQPRDGLYPFLGDFVDLRSPLPQAVVIVWEWQV